MRPACRAAVALLAFSGTLGEVACAPHPERTDRDRRERIAQRYAAYRENFPGVASITPETYLARRDREAFVLLDVRTPEEQAVSMIPGAVTVEAFERTAPTTSSTVLAYCTIGARSGAYARTLQRRGLPALNLEGGILAWTHTGQPLVTSTGETRQVHVYGADWNLAAEGYKAVW